MFFGEQNADDSQLISPRELRVAQSVCYPCPVRLACLEHALRKHIMHGIWAGTSGNTRARIWKAERRGEITRQQVLDAYGAATSTRYERLNPSMSASMSR